MFQQFKNIDSAFKLSRALSIVAIVGSIGFSAFVVYFNEKQNSQKDKKVFVIANGKIFEAFAEERGKYWPIEIRDHVKTFHFYFFTLQPDETFIKKNIEKALHLADNSAASEYNNLRENGFYNSLIAANANQEIESENIEVNLNATPWSFKYTGKIRIIRATTILTRSLVTEGILRITQPADDNPHGLKIEKWRVLENKDISTTNR
jgi:conjugative transposon TraK protein